jgi:hypothetical protein
VTLSRDRVRLESLRSDKWLSMLRNWDAWMAVPGSARRARNRCRKGVPDAMRGAAWQAIGGSRAVRDAAGADAYTRLLLLPLAPATGHSGEREQPARPVRTAASVRASGGAGAAGAVAAAASATPSAAKVSIARASLEPLPSVAALLATLAAGGWAAGNATPEVVDAIERDINRTFPQFALFAEVGGIGAWWGVCNAV